MSNLDLAHNLKPSKILLIVYTIKNGNKLFIEK